jgi:phosphoribosylglycinamide formyltransferase 1
MQARVAVLASGSGTNLQALLDDPVVGPWIVQVVSDRPAAGALARAERLGIATKVIEPSGYYTRLAHDAAMLEAMERHSVEFVLLAGYMRILTAEFISRFEDRIMNVHPSLLPAFPGAHPVRDALHWGAKVTGATVHLVDAEVDHGPIVLQEPVTVLPDDDEVTLHARIQAVEHRIYPLAARLLVEGRLKIESRRVTVLDQPAGVGEASR